MSHPYWEAIDSSLFFTKKDPQDRRLGDFSNSYLGSHSSLDSSDLFLWGYPDHEGIALNGGRIGADKAPDRIRQFFYKMTPHWQVQNLPRISDLGNLMPLGSLGDRHLLGRAAAQALTMQNKNWISLGGGHDYGYADGSGFISACLNKKQRPLIINIDAHMDVRPVTQNFHSGTPFYRLLTEFENEFDLIEVGIQGQCNSRDHIAWAKQRNVKIITIENIKKLGLLQCLKETLLSHSQQPLWLSLDIDGISSNEAPGCSQAWTTGIESIQIFELMTWLSRSLRWNAFSIYEVSPELDQDNRTSKLAALLMFHFLNLKLSQKTELSTLFFGE